MAESAVPSAAPNTEPAMHLIDPNVLRLSYRLLHLLGMAVLVGGAVAVAIHGAGRGGAEQRDGAGDAGDARAMLYAAARYERLFWPVLAVQALTGIGNVGLMGPQAPGLGGPWSVLFGAKLLVIIVVLATSLVRTGLVAQLLAEPDRRLSDHGSRVLRIGYGASAVALSAVVLLAIGMAHG